MSDHTLDIIQYDADGYLVDYHQWNEELAVQIANSLSIVLTESHWLVINFERKFFAEYKTTPPMRLLVKALAKEFGPEIGNSRYLQKMFDQAPAKNIAKIAGLPKPAKCL